MKKIILLFIGIVISVNGLFAQQDFARHEVAVTYGYITTNQFIDVLGTVFTAVFSGGTVERSNSRYTGSFSAEYVYRINKTIGLGGILSYEHSQSDILQNDVPNGTMTDNCFTIMPAAKFNWFSKPLVSMYSKVAVGVSFDKRVQNNYTEDAAAEPEIIRKNNTLFAFQASLVGIEVGKQVCGFAELGLGVQGVICIGVKAKL